MSRPAPKGRLTIRKGLLGDQSSARVVGLWKWDAKPGSTLERLERDAYFVGLDAVDKFDARRATLEKDIRFTPEGRREQLFEFAVKDLAPALKKGRNVVERARQDLADRKSKLQPPKADPSDVAGAMLRREIREWLGRMDVSAQAEFFAKNRDLNPDIALAVLEVPQEMGIVSPTQREKLLDRHMREQAGAEIDDIAELEEAIAKADAAVEQGRDLIQIEASSGDRARFDEAARPYETPVAAPWLRKMGDEVRVVDLAKKVSRTPSQAELDTGIYYADYESYAQANGLTAAKPATDAA